MSQTILLADDSLTIQKVVELTFADTDYDVVAVSSGDELLSRLGETRPDIVICDIIMPGRDGYSVCQQIKSNPSTLHIPVVLLTGTFEPFDKERAVAAGCSEIITKPFEARRLVETVERLTSSETPAAEPFREERFDGQVEPPVPPEVEEIDEEDAYATRISVSATPSVSADEEPAAAAAPPEADVDEEGIDFTDTGFRDMEAAAERPAPEPAPPEEGIDFEFDEGEAVESSGEVKTQGPEPFDTALDDSTPGEPWTARDEDPFADTADEITAPGDVAEDDTAPGLEPEPAEPPEIPEEEPELPAAEAEAVPEIPEPTESDETGAGSPADTAPGLDEAAVETEREEDTAPILTEGATASAHTPTAPAAPGELSDEDVERIARRVVELAADQIERIAWEVLPDMAELVVRRRIRELEAEVEGDTTGDE